MHNSLHLSAYTPSNTEPEILEKIFVQRHTLLKQTVAWCEESITSNKKNHLLFIGPRGSGKTHFISMVINRLKNKPELQAKMVIVWLGEDDVITSLVDLVLLMIEALVKTDPDSFNKDCLKQALGQKPDTIADIILHSISEQIADRTILLVKENMSDVFTGLKDSGQKKFRAYLQEKNNIAILASSQQLFPGISSREAAFFGFFDTYHLKVLNVDDAKQLISNIAALNNNQSLVEYLKTPQGCYRVRALHHLAGGNHRLYVELAAFLTMESLDDFVSALTQLADNLTPYFQERIRSLPAQQGKIVQKLCEMQGASPVKTIAEESFIGERSAAKQLGELAKKGYVLSHKRGKQSYYEMAEPLMRLALEVKSSHGKPLKMVASLIRAWFSDSELQLEQENSNGQLFDYKMAALSMDKEILVSINKQIFQQIISSKATKDYKKIIAASSEIINGPQTEGIPLQQKLHALLTRGVTYHQSGELEQAFQDCTTIIETQNAPDELKAHAVLLRSITYRQKGETELELQDLTTVIEMHNALDEEKANALFNRSIIYLQKGETELAHPDLSAVIEMQNAPAEQKASALFNRSIIYLQKGETELAHPDLSAVIEMQNAPKEFVSLARFVLALAYFNSLEIDKAQQTLENALEQGEENSEYFPSSTKYILQSINRLGPSFWQKQIIWILALYDKHGVLNSLAATLIHSISFFVEDESLLSSFNKWQQLWQQHGEQYQAMQLPLQILQAAKPAIEQKNDKPLMSLPKEVRELVLPLLSKVLSN